MGIDVADLVVKVTADTSGAEAGMGKVNEGAEKSHGLFGKAAGTLGKFLAVGAGIGLVAGAFDIVKDSVGEWIHAGETANQVEAQTNAALKSTHDVSGQTAESVKNLADHIRSMSGIDDDATQTAENMLLTFTNIGKNVFPQATQAVADMATKMAHGAVPSAGQMQQVSVLLGKALNDPIHGITALTRVGVTFSQQQKDQIAAMMKAGDIAGAQKVVLGELNKEFGNSAAALGQSNGGMAIFQATLEHVKETIGQALIPILSGLLSKFSPIADAAANILPGAFQALQSAMQPVQAILQVLSDYGQLFGKMFLDIVQPGINAVRDAFTSLKGPGLNINDLMQKVGDTVAKAQPFIQGVANAVNHILLAIAPLIPKVVEFAEKIGKMVVQQVLDTLKFLGNLFDAVRDAVKNLMPHLQGLTDAFNNDIVPAIQTALPIVLSIAGFLKDLLGGALSFIIPIIGNVAGILIDILVVAINAVSAVIRIVAPIVVDLAKKLGDLLRPIIKNVSQTLSELYHWFNDNVYPIIVKVANYFNANVAPVLRVIAGVVKDQVVFQLHALWAIVSNVILPILGKLADIVKKSIGNAFKLFGDSVKAVTGFIGDLFNWIGIILGKLDDLKNKLHDVFDNFHLPGFAGGGDTAGGFAMVGEEGPEVVAMPKGSHVYSASETRDMLSRRSKASAFLPSSVFGGGGGGGSMTVHAHLHVNGREFSEAIMDDLMPVMHDTVRRATGLRG